MLVTLEYAKVMFPRYNFDVVVTSRMHSTWRMITTCDGQRQGDAQVREERAMEAILEAYRSLVCEATTCDIDARLLLYRRLEVKQIKMHSAARLQVAAAFISGKVSNFKLGHAGRVQEAPRREGRKSVISQDSGDEAFSVVRGLMRRTR